MLFTIAILQESSVSEAIMKAKMNLLPTLKVGWKVWPIVAALNFTIMPVRYRVFFINIIGFFWNTFL